MAALTPTAKMQFFKADGTPLVGGKLYTYTAGTTTPQTTYTDSSGSTANTNPVILDSRGEANIWLGGATYKFKLADANDVEIWTVDNISAPTSGVSPALSGNVTIDTNSSSPALKITQTGTGYALRVQDSADPDSTSTVIDNTGKIGIGTVSPSELLDVSGGNIAMTSAGGVLYAKVTPGASETNFAADGARALTFSTNSTERLRITDTGLVGIGKTPSAGVELDVVGDIAASVSVKTDTVSEFTSAAGVTVDGVLIKDGIVAASARPLTAATSQTTTSGTSVSFHNLPSYVQRISFLLSGVSITGGGPAGFQNILLGTGTSGSPVWINTGYVANFAYFGTASGNGSATAGFCLGNTWANADLISGAYVLHRLSSSVWVISGMARASNSAIYTSAGVLTGAGTITQIQLTTTLGSFDAGDVNIFYE